MFHGNTSEIEAVVVHGDWIYDPVLLESMFGAFALTELKVSADSNGAAR